MLNNASKNINIYLFPKWIIKVFTIFYELIELLRSYFNLVLRLPDTILFFNNFRDVSRLRNINLHRIFLSYIVFQRGVDLGDVRLLYFMLISFISNKKYVLPEE